MPTTPQLPPLPARKTRNNYDGYAPPEDGNAAEYWAEGFNEALEQLQADRRQIVELCASIADRTGSRDTEYVAAAIRALLGDKGEK